MNPEPQAKYAFVVAERPNYDPAGGVHDPAKNWSDFLVNIQNVPRRPEGIETIHDNIWLLQLSNGLPFLAELIRWGGAYQIAIRILFLAEVPNWLQYPSPAEKPSSSGASTVIATGPARIRGL
jgi:hypothetical protein